MSAPIVEQPAKPHAVLTRAVMRVVLEVARTGGTDAELAAALGLRVGTVRSHLKVARTAVGVDTTQKLAVAVARHRVTLSLAPERRGTHLRHPSALAVAR